ncbi:GlxA family transcriptional regulator [Sediminibacterium soli]|uniref:GlxA family transcriptional regulator n=1 Tax=Sediminibacterium soli TaxID=2698829 RepID=UPI0013799FC4|nr:helix-turn-helix domain-containing protein [Sediminibacterium soli]NCI45219.1 helix-turn-helix domain-containing protein [Sediminibacterium soli]
MKQVTILVPESAVLASVDDPRHLFAVVNGLLKEAGKEPLFKVQMAGMTREVKLHDERYTVHTDILVKDIRQTDIIFVPALAGNMEKALEKNSALMPWLVRQYEQGTEIVSLCVGAFLLASTGLLDGKKCSTHWKHANTFRAMFPQVNLVDDRIITEEEGLYSSGGATSYWNLLLYLVEKYVDRPTAIHVAKIFAIEPDRVSQSPFMIFNTQIKHNDEPVRIAQEFIEKNFEEKITVAQLAAMVSIGRRNFERRFKKATSNTVVEYMQRVKIEAAKKNFETSRKNVNEVMYDVGYSDVKAFRTIFRKVTGLSPIEYRNRYHKDAIA